MRGFTWSAIGIEPVPQERIRTAEKLGVHQHQIASAISPRRTATRTCTRCMTLPIPQAPVIFCQEPQLLEGYRLPRPRREGRVVAAREIKDARDLHVHRRERQVWREDPVVRLEGIG